MLTIKKALFLFAAALFILSLSSCGGGTSVITNAPQNQAELASLSITPADATIAQGTNLEFTATGIYSDNTTQDLTAYVTWGSTDASNALFLASGQIHGRAAGRITITARHGRISGSTTLTITQATLVSIAVTPPNPSIAGGTSQQFTAIGTFSDDSTQDITKYVQWDSSSPSVATIGNSVGYQGVAAATTAGRTTITAASGSITASVTLTVNDVVLTSIEVTPVNPSIALGTTRQFMATGIYSDGSTQDLTSETSWASTNTSVASISNTAGSKGLATSGAVGSTTISASSGGKSGSTTLTVTTAALVSIAVTPTGSSLAAGTSRQFTAVGAYSDGSSQNLTSSATWSSMNTGIASISNAAGSKGMATTVGLGSTTILAISGGISGSTTLTVTAAALVSITVTPTGSSIVAGTTRQFTAVGAYSDGSSQNLTSTATWASTNAGIASISNAAGSKGLATAVAAGSTTISATSGGVAGSTTLSVTSATLASITVTPSGSSMETGSTRQFSAVGSYSNGSSQNLTSLVTWASTSAGVASISNAAGSKGLATSVAAGSTIISASSGGISGNTTLTVTAPCMGSATLTWDAPATYTDGSAVNPATDITSYKIYYGTSSGVYSQSITVANPGTSTVSQPLHLACGSYYFVVTAIDTDNNESDHSDEVFKTFL
jgi:trimeric autotransporter adhesin